jgi:hypothetical protein
MNEATENVDTWLWFEPHLRQHVKTVCKKPADFKVLCEKIWGTATPDWKSLDDVEWGKLCEKWTENG